MISLTLGIFLFLRDLRRTSAKRLLRRKKKPRRCDFVAFVLSLPVNYVISAWLKLLFMVKACTCLLILFYCLLNVLYSLQVETKVILLHPKISNFNAFVFVVFASISSLYWSVILGTLHVIYFLITLSIVHMTMNFLSFTSNTFC